MYRIPRARVAVQLVTYNNAKTLEACLRSLFKQNYRDYCLIIVDNASTDTTREILPRLEVIYVASPRNIGYAAGHNFAVRKTESEFVLTLNPDVVLEPHFLERLVSAMELAPATVGSASSVLYRIGHMNERSDVIDSAGLYMTPARRQMLRLSGERSVHVRRQYIFGPDGAAAFYRRAMLEDINQGDGVFDEDFFMHKEDVDVCWRAQLRGWTSIVVPDAVAYHVRTFRAGHRERIDADMRMMAVRNRYYLMIKNELPLLFLRDVLWILLYDVGILFYVFFRERSSLDAYRLVIKNWSKMMKKREIIQRTRRVNSGYMAQWFRRGQV